MTKSVPEALSMLMSKHITKYDENADEWQGWRVNLLYTMAVNDTMEPNKANLRKLYESFYEPRKKYVDVRDCVDLFMTKTVILTKEEHVTYCFGMSKMTVVNEAKEGDSRYSSLSFPEFLEMVGRVAHFKYSPQNGEEYATMPLA